MNYPTRATVERVRRGYPVGCRVELVRMDDPQAPPPGTRGTVWGVDDTASIMVCWDNGGSLNVIYGEDVCRRIQETLREFIQHHPSSDFDILSPMGYVYLTADKVNRLLQGENAVGHAGCRGTEQSIPADMVLAQVIVSCNKEGTVFHLITDNAEEEHTDGE